MKSYEFNKKDTPQRLTGLSIRELAIQITKETDHITENFLSQLFNGYKDRKCKFWLADAITKKISPNAKIEDYFNIIER